MRLKRLLPVFLLFLLSSAEGKELYYDGGEFTLKVPAYDITTVNVPCTVTSKAYPKEKLQLKSVKTGSGTTVYLLPKDEPAVVVLSCVDRSYVLKLFPVDLRPKKKLECKNGKCTIVEEKPKETLKDLDANYTIVDSGIVKEEEGGVESSFSSKEAIIDEAVKLMSAMVEEKKPGGYVVRKKPLTYYLTPDISVSLQKFYKGLLYGQVVLLRNESYFPVTFDVKSLDGNGNVLLYSPSMDKNGIIRFAPKGEALLYVVQVRKGLKLPFKEVAERKEGEEGEGEKNKKATMETCWFCKGK